MGFLSLNNNVSCVNNERINFTCCGLLFHMHFLCVCFKLASLQHTPTTPIGVVGGEVEYLPAFMQLLCLFMSSKCCLHSVGKSVFVKGDHTGVYLHTHLQYAIIISFDIEYCKVYVDIHHLDWSGFINFL